MTRACPPHATSPSNRLLAGLALAAASLFAISLPSAQAASQTWNNGAANLAWNLTDLNWSGAAWTNNNDAVFGATGVGSIAAAPGVSFNDIAFNTTGYTITGTLALGLDQASTITTASGVTGTISAVLSNGSGGATSLTKAGSGTLTLSGANTYSGGTTLNAGLLLVQGSSTPTTGTVTSGPLGTGTLTLTSGTFGFVGGAFTIANNVSVGGATNIMVSSGANEVLNGNWSGTGNLTLIGNGSTGQWQFGGDNSGYTGTFTENAGNTSLTFNSASAGSANANWIFNNPTNQRTRLNFGAGTINFGSIAGNGSIANIAASGSAIMSVGALNTSTTYSGVIGGSTAGQGQNISLTKVGSGTLTLSGANTYTGVTTLNAGTLLINGSLASGSAVSVTAGTLGGAGNGTTTGIIGGATVLSAGAKLSPGTSAGLVGTLTFSNGLNLSASSNDTGAYIFNLDAVGSSDKITLTSVTANALNVGTLDAADFTFTTGGSFGAGTYILFDANSAIAGNIGTASVNFGGGLTGTLSIDSINNDVLLTVVPEPSTVLLTAVGFVVVLWRSRRVRA